MSFSTVEPRRMNAAERTLAEELGRRTALYVHNARLYEEARQAVRARDDLLAVVSHDLKNPLVAILVQASLVARCEEARSERVRRNIDSIQRSAERMRRFIHDTLDMVAIEAGRLKLAREQCEPTALIAEALDLIQPLAVEKSIRLHAAIPSFCPSVMCDRERVAQVFSNLVGNAVKFTPERGEILVQAVADDADPTNVRFCVEDTGPGIPPPELPRLFEKYWRAGRGDAAEREGTGLGLSIVKGIVEAHGGRVWAESTVGTGSRFYFTLPAAPPS
jgi:signal transduction histidine kinase